MFKRIIAFILLFVFMCFKCITWVPSAAATGIPAFDAFYYAILQTLGMAYTNGVELDLAPAIAEVREAVPDYLQQPDVALKYLLRDYAGHAWDYIANTWNSSTFDENNPYLQNTAAIGLANSSGMAVPTLQDIVTQWGSKALDNDKDIVTPINTNTVAYFNKFNDLYINEYLERMDDSQIEQEEQIVDRVNIGTFFASNLPGGQTNISAVGYYEQGFSYTPEWSNETYTGLKYPFIVRLRLEDGWSYYDAVGYNVQGLNKHGNRCFIPCQSETPNIVSNYPIFYNIVDAINYSRSGQFGYAATFGASVPNAVIDNSNEDGKIVSHPIYWVINNNTGTPIDSQINLDKLIDYLKGVIDGSNSDTDTSFGDLVDAGVIEDTDGNTIADSDVIAVPISEVIEDALARDDPIAIPEAITGPVPPLPPLPPFFPTPDFPEGDPTSGFNGMSVLARIINITNQSLPGELIVVFYGVIFGAVILGLIKILHK